MEAAIWLIKYGARIAGKEDITEADAKIVHKAFSFTMQILARWRPFLTRKMYRVIFENWKKSFKQAGGIFEQVRMESEKLLDPSEPASDMDNHIIECYQLQESFHRREFLRCISNRAMHPEPCMFGRG